MDEPSPPASTSTLAGWGAFAICSAIWGSTFLVISIGNDSVPPLWAASIRLALASVLLVLLAFLTGSGLPRGQALVAASQFGALNFGLQFCLLYWAEKHVPSGPTAVVYGTIPLTTALFAAAFGLERLRPLKLIAAAISLLGVAILFSAQLAASVPPLSLAAALIAATSASLSGIALKRGPRQHPIGANAVAAMVGFVVCILMSFVAREPHAIPTSAAAWLPILYLTLAGSIGAFVVYAWLVNRWRVTRISFIAVIVPIVALALGTVVRHERLPGGSVAGATLVFLGLGLGIAADRAARA